MGKEDDMGSVIETIFGGLSMMFDKVPFMSKIKGYRSVIGLVGLAVVAVLKNLGVGDVEILGYVNLGFMGFTGLALNAKTN